MPYYALVYSKSMVNSNTLGKMISKRLTKYHLFYVCRDIERAFIPETDLANYYIITNKTSYAADLARKFSNIILVENNKPMDTDELLQWAAATNTIPSKHFVLVFKNNALIEKICAQQKWRLLNPAAQLADMIEGKISQITWLGATAKKYMPAHQVTACEKVQWKQKPFILQFNHSHTGSGTFFINNARALSRLQQQFPKRPVRAVQFISGPVFTNNNIIWNKSVIIGNISYQITGLKPFTDNQFSTIGNDWALPHMLLSKKQFAQYKKLVRAVGVKLHARGWKGLFGVDVILNQKTGELHLLEINARQPASSMFESWLQTRANSNGNTVFLAHLAALLNIKTKDNSIITITDGAQIVQRVTKKITDARLRLQNPALIKAISYQNTKPGADLLRIQSSQSIMQQHNKLNTFGKNIRTALC